MGQGPNSQHQTLLSCARLMICEGQQRLSGLSLIQKVLKMGKPRDIDFEKLQLCGERQLLISKRRRSQLHFI